MLGVSNPGHLKALIQFHAILQSLCSRCREASCADIQVPAHLISQLSCAEEYLSICLLGRLTDTLSCSTCESAHKRRLKPRWRAPEACRDLA